MQIIWEKLKNEFGRFCSKNNFKEVVLGLSGGLDSAIVAVLAADVLGGENVHTLMMKTKYTSDLSLEIATKIAQLNNLDHKEIDLQPTIDAQQKFLNEVFEESPKNIVIENLQARERGKILMAISNQFGYLVLACGNKSEAAMGYCTLYGDTCGGIMPIGNLYKSEIFELAKWRNSIRQALPDKVISRAPSAELAPGQKDEDSLPPYALLDKILALYLDEKQTLTQIESKGYDRQTVEWIIKRYQAQEFKRRQLPPSLNL